MKMKITDEAKKIVEEVLKENNCNALLVSIVGGCCGSSINLALANAKEDDEISDVNGISVIYDQEAVQRTGLVILDVQKGKLFLKDDQASNC
jgi:Fe-S cluster assembly iron-binding protein IscA